MLKMLLEQLKNDMKDAMKTKNKVQLNTIRMVNAAIQSVLHSSNKKENISDEDILAIIQKEVKMRNDSISEFEKGNRQDLIENTKQEINFLMKYLPKQLSKDEINAIVRQAITELGITQVTKKDIGKIMKIVMPQVKGKADGKLVNKVVNTFM